MKKAAIDDKNAISHAGETKKTITLVQFTKYANDNNILWYYNIPNYEDEEGNLRCNMPTRIRKKLGIK